MHVWRDAPVALQSAIKYARELALAARGARENGSGGRRGAKPRLGGPIGEKLS